MYFSEGHGSAGKKYERYLAPQLSWLTGREGEGGNPDGKVIVKYIGRFESLERDFNRIRSRLFPGPIDKPLPVINVSLNKPDYRSLYTDEMVEIVRDFYIQDIEYFGYEFE